MIRRNDRGGKPASASDGAREDLLEAGRSLITRTVESGTTRKRAASNRSSEFTWRMEHGLQLELQHSLLEPPKSRVPRRTFNEFPGHGQLVSCFEIPCIVPKTTWIVRRSATNTRVPLHSQGHSKAASENFNYKPSQNNTEWIKMLQVARCFVYRNFLHSQEHSKAASESFNYKPSQNNTEWIKMLQVARCFVYRNFLV